jgi:sulfate adenylyltransferase subunit 2
MSSILKTNALESEAIYIFREVISQFDKPVLLFLEEKIQLHW